MCRLLHLEAWRESAQRALMFAFAAQGQRAAAFAQYDACKKNLARYFDAEPERETLALYESIRAGTFVAPPAAVSNLQSPLTPITGRARELEILTARLLDPTQRLHTIVGPGGIGKTRLALAAAERVREDFEHGAFFAALSGIESATPNLNDVIATAIAGALGITFSGSDAPARQLQTFLRDKEMLLVLDNLEPLIAGAAWIVELATTPPHLTILGTSREPLNARAEMLFRLDGLGVPGAADRLDLRASDSVQLFVERAARAAGQFTVTPETLGFVGAICRRVEGMPLALELAAAWTRTRTLSEIVAALDENLDSLVTQQPDVPARHASLRAAWQGSWGMLALPEQTILSRTEVFRGGFEQDAPKITIKSEQVDLDTLLDKSLLKRTEHGRYELHELLHQFTVENESNGIKRIYKQHCAYFMEYTAQRGKLLQKGDPHVAFSEIRHELDNLRAAWQNAIEHEWFELFQPEIIEGITAFYYLTGLFREGLTMIEQALASREKFPNAPRELVAALRLARAKFFERLAQYDKATAEFAILLADETIDALLRARAQLRVGWVCYWTGKLEQGRSILQETLRWASAAKETPPRR